MACVAQGWPTVSDRSDPNLELAFEGAAHRYWENVKTHLAPVAHLQEQLGELLRSAFRAGARQGLAIARRERLVVNATMPLDGKDAPCPSAEAWRQWTVYTARCAVGEDEVRRIENDRSLQSIFMAGWSGGYVDGHEDGKNLAGPIVQGDPA